MQLDFEPGWTGVAGAASRHARGHEIHRCQRPGESAGRNSPRILCRWVLFRKAAVPGGGAAYGAGREAVDDIGRDRGGGRDEEKHDQSIIRTAALGNRHDRQPFYAGLRGHPCPGDALHDGRHGIDHEAGKIPARTQRTASVIIARATSDRPRRHVPPPRSAAVRETQSQRHARNRLRQRRRKASSAPTPAGEVSAPMRQPWTEQNGLKEQPFRRKSIKRGSAEIAAHATRNAKLVTGIGG